MGSEAWPEEVGERGGGGRKKWDENETMSLNFPSEVYFCRYKLIVSGKTPESAMRINVKADLSVRRVKYFKVKVPRFLFFFREIFKGTRFERLVLEVLLTWTVLLLFLSYFVFWDNKSAVLMKQRLVRNVLYQYLDTSLVRRWSCKRSLASHTYAFQQNESCQQIHFVLHSRVVYFRKLQVHLIFSDFYNCVQIIYNI